MKSTTPRTDAMWDEYWTSFPTEVASKSERMFFDMKFKELERELNQKMNAASPVTVNLTEDAFYEKAERNLSGILPVIEKAEQEIGDCPFMGTATSESSLDRNCGNCANRVDGVCKVLTPFIDMVSPQCNESDLPNLVLTVCPPDDFVCVKWEPPQ